MSSHEEEGKASYSSLSLKQLHPDFSAEIEGVDFPRPSEEQFQDILAAMAEYGVRAFRNTGMDDAAHVQYSHRFRDLDDIRPYVTNVRKMRYEVCELFDAGNVDEGGNVIHPLFGASGAFAAPPGHGGDIEFADSRTAFDELPQSYKGELLEKDYVAAHSMAHSRKTAAPEFFKELDVEAQSMHYHKLIQLHEPSNRMNIYVAAHAHHIVGLSKPNSERILNGLLEHVSQRKYRISVPWRNVGDHIIWDNTCVLHRAGPGTCAGKYKRDLRRTTVHDASSTAWGLNDREGNTRPRFSL